MSDSKMTIEDAPTIFNGVRVALVVDLSDGTKIRRGIELAFTDESISPSAGFVAAARELTKQIRAMLRAVEPSDAEAAKRADE